ncbi:hypothetical protein EJ04DRAFT_576568 [Polyplosphaeria fusca]|uniref:WW domain-containing protein n=1 Tax=Polyplosphaeria fusca TaxID=682080 RepID=A0A9P4QVV1_9PLEO|nr:hypothetical protein EJ04DRAFT_576568 [Polyplosphaeria fusca]
MSEFAPPTGPPPPKVPEGWKAVWNDQYSEWFFVNIYTKKSQWDKPDTPVYPPGEQPLALDAPPTYAPSKSPAPTDEKRLASNNPYAGEVRKSQDISEDERLARQLQEEENARAHGSAAGDRGAADNYYQQGGYGQGNMYPPQSESPYPHSQSPYQQSQSPYPQQGYEGEKGKSKGGFLGKLLGKSSSKPSYGSPALHQQGPYQQPGYGAPGGGYYNQGQPGPGYYPQQQMYGQPGRKKPGMGAGGAAALGVGGGLLGGALIGSALAGDGGDTYVENNDYGDDGGDFGGDDGGGDFGGDF